MDFLGTLPFQCVCSAHRSTTSCLVRSMSGQRLHGSRIDRRYRDLALWEVAVRIGTAWPYDCITEVAVIGCSDSTVTTTGRNTAS